MKRIIMAALVAAVGLIATTGAKAQFRYGVTAGVDISSLHFKQDLFTVDSSVGYSAGLMGEMMFPGIGFGIDVGLQYSQLGATMDLGQKDIWASEGYGRVRSYLHYIMVPLHLRFKYTRLNGFEDQLAPFVYVGPSFGFLAAHNKLDAMDYAGGDMGIDFGIGAEIFTKWQVSAHYRMGMTYAMKAKLLTDMSGRNNVWSVRVSYIF
ncbi:MAG: PorT family protein [Muribaculaceae bacterium]|nr:PorT family protein [Muribaculaceae bacterium]